MSYFGRRQTFRPHLPKLLTNPNDILFNAASNSGYEASLSTYSFPYSCGGDNRLILVGVNVFAAGTVSTVATDISESFTSVRAQVNGIYRTEIWKLVNPTARAGTITVTLSASLTSIADAVAYTGVNQSLPLESDTDNTGTGPTSATVAVTPIADKCWVFGTVATSDAAITVHGGDNERDNNAGALGTGAASDSGVVTPASSRTLQWDNIAAAASWVMVGVAIRPASASGGGSTPNTAVMQMNYDNSIYARYIASTTGIVAY